MTAFGLLLAGMIEAGDSPHKLAILDILEAQAQREAQLRVLFRRDNLDAALVERILQT